MLTNTKDETREFDPRDIQKNRMIALVSYIWIGCLVPLFAAKDSKFARYHANQGIVLAIVETLLIAILRVLSRIPILGIVFTIVRVVAIIAAVVFSLLGIMNAYSGRAKQLPFIGAYKLID